METQSVLQHTTWAQPTASKPHKILEEDLKLCWLSSQFTPLNFSSILGVENSYLPFQVKVIC